MPLHCRLLCVALCVLSPCTASAASSNSARSVAAGSNHTCAVTTTGGLECWGSNGYNQLGVGPVNEATRPTDVPGLTTGVVAAGAGLGHTCVVTLAGGARCWGRNSEGQVGDGTNAWRSTPTDVSGLTSGVAALSVGGFHTCALTTSGGVRCWGANDNGQLGDGTTTSRMTPVDVTDVASGAIAIAAGTYHTCAVTAAGGVKCWGRNWLGQLGDGTLTSRSTPVGVVGLASGVDRVDAGDGHSCALTAAGGVKCWGRGYFGALGDGGTTDRATPVDVSGLGGGVAIVDAGGNHTCAVTTSGGVKCWGANASGQMGDGSSADRLTPVDVSGLGRGVAALSAGGDHTCAVTAGGGIRCWGADEARQLGDGVPMFRSTPVEAYGLTSGEAGVAVGSAYTCALSTAGSARCWGSNFSGQLGDGTTTSRRTVRDVLGLTSGVSTVRSGGSHTCAMTTAGGVKCWGTNLSGGLGDGTTSTRTTPVDVSGLSSGALAVSVGGGYTCAVTTGGGVKCWGNNSYGQLGDGTTASRSTPAPVSGLTNGIATVAAGEGHVCALTTTGGVKCWGANWYGQLGDGTTTSRVTPADVVGLTSGVVALAAGGDHTCAVTATGAAKCWGANGFGQLGNATWADWATTPADVSGLGSGVSAIAAGQDHTCAVIAGGGLKCWGHNGNGQLGAGSTTSSAAPVDVVGLASGVADVDAGFSHTCAVTTAGGIKCWGSDVYGELGDLANRTPFVPVRTRGFGRADFDGDDKIDVAVYRPSAGTWFSLDSSGGSHYRGWGIEAQGDTPVVGDFDGDGINDPTVFRPASGTWFILESHANYTTWKYFGWGNSTDTLVPGDYDGDGMTDAAVYRPSEGKWYVRPSNGGTEWNVTFGEAGDMAIAGDFDGDGKRDPAVYRASTGTWFWLESSTNLTTSDYKGWGVDAQADTPAPGDYDGDGKTDLCVFRPASGTWFVLQSSTGSMSYFGWGTTGDTLVPADYDGDGKTDGAIYRASNGMWYIKPSSGAAQWSAKFGDPGDVPLVVIR